MNHAAYRQCAAAATNVRLSLKLTDIADDDDHGALSGNVRDNSPPPDPNLNLTTTRNPNQ